ncbi:hypothetical protein CSV71_14610 [Sporosarcina sp. P21c]|nr:hypothetical protein CSV78_11870 [Sporosarcina sp. P16a]PIC88450.1 hypothetical protein CSV71_14610 [Sporosarcina sp. P21c]PIC91612.1 hypothetical protein CSV70_14575 [Sporosarcina sp. P25]
MLYFALVSVIIFSAVISPAIGFLVYQASNRFFKSTLIQHSLGIAATVLVCCFLTNLLLFGIWYYYVIVISLGVILYIVFIKSSMNMKQR